MKGKKILLESFGCTMNRGEGEKAADILSRSGKEILLDENAEHDTVLLFTCAVIETTERKMWKRIESATRDGKEVIVGGCLASLRSEEIHKRYPDASVLDTMGLPRLGISLGEDLLNLPPSQTPRVRPLDRLDNIVPISTGCKGSCTYCVTRYARGGLICYPPTCIKNMITAGLVDGRSEILLTSQDSASYRHTDDNGQVYDLGTLLSELNRDVKGDHMIRVGMMNPDTGMEIRESLIRAFEDDHIFKFLHIPLQSGSDEVLGTMNRKYSFKQYLEFIHELRLHFPDLTLSTDIIIGFPGESEGQFQKSVEAVKLLRPNILNITRFSSRSGTAASRMKGHLPGWMVKERSREMTAVHQIITQDLLYSRTGKHERCLVTEVGKKGTMMARDINYTPIVIEGDRSLLGRFIDVDANDIGPSYLIAGKDLSLVG
ncbi:MAG: tRNA (N(6)-L-threonylcarbamoyladenosine(37)-C(2))-methylthiotransferase [Thermoplasmata archaeon]|nr:tRNA (N(6)-L-threonylcarbamoyladenosine(37)-C(2))-methylthiotransferase [Thermoplasmata archaeon]